MRSYTILYMPLSLKIYIILALYIFKIVYHSIDSKYIIGSIFLINYIIFINLYFSKYISSFIF